MKPAPTEQIDEQSLIEYDELDPVRQAEVDRYLDQHPDARALADAYRADLECVKGGLVEPPSPAAPTVDAIEHRVYRQRAYRRVVYSAGAACAACALAMALWLVRVSTPAQIPASGYEMETRVAELNGRIADLERLVADLEASFDAREPVSIELSLGEIEREGTAAILFEAGKYYERDNRDIEIALSRYREITTRFPNTKSAASAKERIRALTQASENRRVES
ncbi:MAG: hypothetical protein IT365_23335 [Candidatus Hydrogenedentes bacterium]|nr:hypothetical protein [Candidatus Hydrogenedentota bacterium]